jgi:hypothetical protein
MKKIAVFVEGQTELIFVREYLLKWFEYSNISIDCYNLFSDKLHQTKYPFPNPDVDFHYQIINVGSDARVLSQMLKREKRLRNAGFSLIIGLRDMFSDDYKKVSATRGVQASINQRFIAGADNQIQARAVDPSSFSLCWAIMEIEAWMLGLCHFFEKIDDRLSQRSILDIEVIKTFFNSKKKLRYL